MSEHVGGVPYFIQIDEPVQTIQLSSESFGRLNTQLLQTHQNLALNSLDNTQIFVELPENPVELIQESTESSAQIIDDDTPCIYQIVYPQDLNLRPAYTALKRGRPKKKKCDDEKRDVIIKTADKSETTAKPPKTARTRSGRLVQVPKHIEKDFKKIETAADEQEIQVSDFKRFEEKENTKSEFRPISAKKRQISSQYKCPKCSKAYLGKARMIQHLKKYPDHGPLPEGQKEYNFDVWNYLFDITQKSKPGQRGMKFCEELSNLLHNLQLLKSALFKTVTDNKNCVQIDKVLGNAIGLAPGKYKFDENELYKDVTVLKLITNSDFFQPNTKCQNETVSNVSKQSDLIIEKQDGEIIKDSKPSDNLYNCSYSATKCKDEITSFATKKMEDVTQLSLHPDLLSENLLLNPRTSVDELMLSSVDNGSGLLDNSTSLDDVMNVDQFVNERFKKIIEPDIELANSSLNLDLPSLELFQFHTT